MSGQDSIGRCAPPQHGHFRQGVCGDTVLASHTPPTPVYVIAKGAQRTTMRAHSLTRTPVRRQTHGRSPMKTLFAACLLLALAVPALADTKAEPAWSMNATAIEGCSCQMFCQCYFASEPSGHHGMDGMKEEHFCRFNNAYKINKGNWGATKLDGAKFWLYGDLGADFSDGEMDWAVLTFDKATTKEQREAIGAICGKLFPVKWKTPVAPAEGESEWVATSNEAHATINGGKVAEVRLSTAAMNTNTKNKPTVITNLKYFGAPRNDGFVLMPNTIETLRTGDKPYEFKGTNGFMITIDMNSKDFAPGAGAKSGM